MTNEEPRPDRSGFAGWVLQGCASSAHLGSSAHFFRYYGAEDVAKVETFAYGGATWAMAPAFANWFASAFAYLNIRFCFPLQSGTHFAYNISECGKI